jgi:hypothetical protein
MLKLVQYDEDARQDDTPDVLPFPVGLARSRGKTARDLPMDRGSDDAAWQVEQAMLDVELNFLKLKRLFEEAEGDGPRAA